MWPFSEMSLPLATFWADVSNIVIVIGLAVSLVATLASMRLSNVKERHWDGAREKSQEQITILESETSKAKLDLAKAMEETARLSADAESSRAAIAGSNERTALADLKAAEAIERARKLELDIIKIQTPLTLTQEQQDTMVKLLAPSPKGPTAIAFALFDSTDAKQFATSIEETLKRAGFELSEAPGSLGKNLGWDRPGAWLFVNDIKQPPPHAVQLQVAFAAIGIYLDGNSRPNDVPPGMAVIAVSSHPLKPAPIPDALLKTIENMK